MASFVLKDAKVLYDERNISGIINQIALSFNADLQDDTTVDSDTRSRLAGLLNAMVEQEGFFEAADDNNFFDNTNYGNEGIATIIPDNSGNENVRCFFLKVRQAEYTPGATIGEIFSFSLNMESNSALIKGKVSQDGSETADGEGSVLNLGAVAAGSTLYAALHVLSVSGGTSPNLDVTIVSDDDGTFDSASTTRITFNQFNAAGSQFASVAGAITDTHYRAEWTISDDSGGSPTFAFVVVIGISDK